MKINKTIILLSVATLTLSVFAFKSIPEKKAYNYLTIHTFNNDEDLVYVSIGGKEYKRMNLSRQTKGKWDFNPLINLITEYENQGWELQSITALKAADKFVLMRQEK